MAPPVEPFIGVQPLQDNAANNDTTSDAERVHRAMNSGLRPVERERQLDDYMHIGFMMVSLYASSVEVVGQRGFYNVVQTHLISEWTKSRDALVRALDKARRIPSNSSPVASMYLDRDSRGQGHVYRGLEHRSQDGLFDTMNYIYSAIGMQILMAWDESIRQNSTEFFDRQFSDAIATLNRRRGPNVQPADVQLANVQPANFQPVGFQPFNLQPFNLQPVNFQPANFQPANVQPANVWAGGNGGAGAGSFLQQNPSAGRQRIPAARIANPVLGNEIIIGSWAQAPDYGSGAGPNAVVGTIDRRGRLNYRIIARTMDGIPVPAPTSTSTSLLSINLRGPYAGLGHNRLRAMVIHHLRLPRHLRP